MYMLTTADGHTATLVQDTDEQGRYRWLNADGQDTEVSGATEEEAVLAGRAAWPGCVVTRFGRISAL